MTICERCGTPNDESARFCDNCGTPLPGPSAQQPPDQPAGDQPTAGAGAGADDQATRIGPAAHRDHRAHQEHHRAGERQHQVQGLMPAGADEAAVVVGDDQRHDGDRRGEGAAPQDDLPQVPPRSRAQIWHLGVG